ncbi:MAG: ribonuclease HII [Coriobacteriia bacterium]|nr:ribonuclease HII [Coriobacteriia bacterium]
MDTRSVAEIRALFKATPFEELDSFVAEFSCDPRAGVQTLVRAAQHKCQAERDERERIQRMMALQLRLHEAGYMVIAGVDEVGRGALAGPVSAAAAVLDAGVHIPGLDDSKRLTPAAREIVAERVRKAAIALSVAHVTSDRVDALGIARANTLAMCMALQELPHAVDHVIADGLEVDLCMPSTFVVGGDRLCACVAAASVVAKVERDSLMREFDSTYPGYDFAINKGYGTVEHIEAIDRLGPSPVHRLSFAPCSQHRLF